MVSTALYEQILNQGMFDNHLGYLSEDIYQTFQEKNKQQKLAIRKLIRQWMRCVPLL